MRRANRKSGQGLQDLDRQAAQINLTPLRRPPRRRRRPANPDRVPPAAPVTPILSATRRLGVDRLDSFGIRRISHAWATRKYRGWDNGAGRKAPVRRDQNGHEGSEVSDLPFIDTEVADLFEDDRHQIAHPATEDQRTALALPNR